MGSLLGSIEQQNFILLKKKLLRVIWNKVQQSLLHQYVSLQLDIDWNEVSKFIYFQSSGKYFKRGKQCRQHWFNHLDNKIVKGGWSVSEDLVILEAVLQKGKKWAQMTNGTDNKKSIQLFDYLCQKNNKNKIVQHELKLNNRFYEREDSQSPINTQDWLQIQKTDRKLGVRRQSYEFIFHIEHLNQFHLSNNFNNQNMKLQVQPNQLKTQFCDSAEQQSFINYTQSEMQQKPDKIKIEHIENTDKNEKDQENVDMTIRQNINLGQAFKSAGFHRTQLYIGQPYSYYYPILFYPSV